MACLTIIAGTLLLIRRCGIPTRLVGLILLLLVPPLILTLRDRDGQLGVDILEVGNGDCTFIRTPAGRTILIDTGNPAVDGKGFMPAGYLKAQRIGFIDVVVITHAHRDHNGGFAGLTELVPIGRVLVTDDYLRTVDGADMVRLARSRCFDLVPVIDTLTFVVDEVILSVLHPGFGCVPDNENNASLVLRLQYRDLSILFTGDIEAGVERDLVARMPQKLAVDILKVPHHGADTSSDWDFIMATSPTLAVIPASVKGKTRVLDAVIPQRYEMINATTLITGRDGAVRIVSDGETMKVATVGSLVRKRFSCRHETGALSQIR